MTFLLARTLGASAAVALVLTSVSSASEIIKIGIVSNFTEASPTNANPYGDYFRKGVTLALEDAQSNLKARGLDLQTEEFDYGTSQVRVLDAARKASDSKVVAVLGYNYSSHALLAAPMHQSRKLPMLTPSATANRLASYGPYVHMGAFSNAWMGRQLAIVAAGRFKAKNVVLLPASDCAYCTDLAQAFRTAFEAKGGHIVVQTDVLEAQTDFTHVLKELKGKDIDLILIPNQEVSSARLIYALLNAGIDKPFLGGDGWGNDGEAFFRILGNRPINAFSTTHWHPAMTDATSKWFCARYLKRFGVVPNDSAVLAYDSMGLLVEAVLRAKTLDRAGVEESLATLGTYDGVTGHFFFAKGAAPQKRIVLMAAKSGHFEIDSVVEP